MKRQLEDTRIRKVLWICLLGLTIIILLFPVSISPDYPLPVQSIYVFSNLSIFAGLFYAWMFLLLTLLFSKKEQKFEKLALSLIFTLVFLQFWTIISPWGRTGDGIWQMAHVHYLQEQGTIPPKGHPSFGYFTFPAIHLLGLPISEVCNLQIFHARIIFLIANSLIFTSILFVSFLKLLKSLFYSSLGVILLITSSVMIGTAMNHFHPISLATTYIALFVLLLMEGQSSLFKAWQARTIFIILAIAATIEYLFTPFFFFLIILSTYTLYNFFKERQIARATTAAIPALFILTWEMYWTTYVTGNYSFNSIISTFPRILEDIRAGEFFTLTGQLLGANVGPGYPWWGNITRFFWWIFVFGFGSFLMFWKLPFFKKYNHLERVELAGFIGTVLVVLLGSIGIRGAAHGGFTRYLWVAPFFIIPALIRFSSDSKFKNYAFPFLFAALLIFSLPSFLTNMDTISRGYTYAQECSLGEHLSSIYGKGESLDLYGFGDSLSWSKLYLVDVKRFSSGSPEMLKEEELWERVNNVVKRFSESASGAKFFISSPKGQLVYQEYLEISPDDPHWMEIESKLSEFKRVYDNGQIKLYQNRGKRI